jgi:hypothetical protein
MGNTILDRADELGLTIIETTSEGNGYPRNLKTAIVGFEDFEDAENFAQENGGEIIELKRKAGQQLWSRGSRAFEPFYMSTIYGNDPNCEIYFCGDEERFIDNVKEQIAELNDFALIQSYVEEKSEIWDEFCTLGENEFILVKDGKFEDVIEEERMDYEYDSTYYRIGVI